MVEQVYVLTFQFMRRHQSSPQVNSIINTSPPVQFFAASHGQCNFRPTFCEQKRERKKKSFLAKLRAPPSCIGEEF